MIILVYEEDELEKQKRRVEEELDRRRRKEAEECKSGIEKHSVQNEFVEVQSAWNTLYHTVLEIKAG